MRVFIANVAVGFGLMAIFLGITHEINPSNPILERYMQNPVPLWIFFSSLVWGIRYAYSKIKK